MNPAIMALIDLAAKQFNNAMDVGVWQKLQLRNQTNDWQKRFDIQNQRQDFLNQSQFSTLASSARSGGFSPLAALGGQFSGNVANPSSGSLMQTDHADPLEAMAKAAEMNNMTAQNNNLLAQNDVLKEEAKVKSEQARKQSIENAREEASDQWFKDHPVWSYVTITNPDGTSETHEHIVESFANKGAFDAAQARNAYEANFAENQARREEANLTQTIAYFKRTNPDVLEAIATMPITEKQQAQAAIANIFKDIEKKNADIDNVKAETLYKQLRTQIERDTNLQMLIRDLGVDPSAAIDILILLTAGDGLHSGAGVDIASKVLDFIKLKKGNLPTDKGGKPAKSAKSKDNSDKSDKSKGKWVPSEGYDWTDYMNGN